MRRHPDVVEYVVELRRERQMDEVTLLFESADAATGGLLTAELRAALGVRIDCRQVAAGSLPRSELKARRLVRVSS